MASWTCIALCAALGLLVAGVTARPESPRSPVHAPRALNATRVSASSKGGMEYRLPMVAIPTTYTVILNVDIPSADTFSGKVDIQLIALRRVGYLTLHANPKVFDPFKVEDITIKRDAGKVPVITAVEQNEELETLTLQLQPNLVVGESYKLSIPFKGKLRTDMYGFYKSTYSKDGKDIVLAATQFEPTHARSAFPCFDEPLYKAKFTLTITHDSSLTALSNTPGTRQATTGNTQTTTSFEQTPEMSSYLVAFVISDFESVSAPAMNPAPSVLSKYKVWVRPGQTAQATYAADVGAKALQKLETYTGISFDTFGIGKLDLVAIPDFSAGAMENWGLITFRETALMYTQDESTESSKESIALVIAHEQAHMWFGDLVSPEWWSYVWLNEGFARYMQYVAVDLVHTDWRLMDTFVVKTLQGALSLDALASSHPMSATVYSPDEIQGIFDRISYDKGASILHMTRKVMGDDSFKQALRDYLTEMKFSVATPLDLFRAFDNQSNFNTPLPKDVKMAQILKTWTEEAGYPVVTIQLADKTATVYQTRYLSSGTEKASNETRWWVPLTYKQAADATSRKMWLNPEAESTKIEGLSDGWIIANIDQEGFYRVNYDDSNWEALSKHLQEDQGHQGGKLSVLSRAQLLDDSLSLARSGHLRYHLALDMTRYLKNETDPIPWTAALPHLNFLARMVGNTNAQAGFKTYVLGLLETIYKAVGFDETSTDDHLTLTLRSSVLSQACSLGDKDCEDKATAAFSAFKADPTKTVKPSLRSAVYCTGLRKGTEAEWDFLWTRYQAATTTPGEKNLILGALGCTTSTAVLNTYLMKSLDNTAVRAQDASTVFSAVLGASEANLNLAFEFFKKEFEKMNTAYGGWSSMQKVVEGLADRIQDETKLKELEDILTANSAKLGVAAAASVRSLETARSNIAWRTNNLKTVANWLEGTSDNIGNGSLSINAASTSTVFVLLLAVLCSSRH